MHKAPVLCEQVSNPKDSTLLQGDAALQSASRGVLQADNPSTAQVGPPPPPPPPAMLPDLPAARVTVVKTADELRAAGTARAQDIEIQAHLDLRSLRRIVNPDAPDSEPPASLLYAREMMRSMRVRPQPQKTRMSAPPSSQPV